MVRVLLSCQGLSERARSIRITSGGELLSVSSCSFKSSFGVRSYGGNEDERFVDPSGEVGANNGFKVVCTGYSLSRQDLLSEGKLNAAHPSKK